MIDKKTLLIIGATVIFLIIVGVVSFRQHIQPLPTDKAAEEIHRQAVIEQPVKKKVRPEPIVVDVEPEFTRPKSTDIVIWNSYNKKIYEKMEKEMEPEFKEKFVAELEKRYTPETEERMQKIDEDIERLKTELDNDPFNKDTKKQLQDLLDTKSTYNAIKKIFLKER